ncbi:MAG: TetR/AcrR family transcriptional regulator [Acidobacteria bacterium]|nr:TetR/AcrR family transcriptional regulator [Acidobacteriota bacterium]
MPKTEHSHHPAFDRKLALILRYAARVFSEKGFEGASVRDISRASGVSLSGLYYYFESKQKLLYLIQLYAFSNIVRRLEERLAAVTDPVVRVRILVRNHLDYFLHHPAEMKVLSHEADELEGRFRREIAEIKKRYYSLALGIFEDLRSSGAVRRMNPRVAVLSLFGMMNWIYTWYNPKVDPSPEAIADTMAGIFLEGVANGHRPLRVSNGRANRVAHSTRREPEFAVRAAS